MAKSKSNPKKDAESKKLICLVTGASAGIGAALAKEFAENGWDLVLTARREEPMIRLAQHLKSTYGTTSHILPADLYTDGAVDDIFNRLAIKGVKIDGLINNAGLGMPGNFIDLDWEDHDKFMHLMMSVPIELCRKSVEHMRNQNFGRIINVASLAGYIPGSKGHTLYGAVKAFLIKFSESLNLELADQGVHVCALCPGFTYSEFHDVNGTREGVSKLPDWMWMEAEDVAEAGYYAVERNRAVFIPGRANKSIATLAKVLPHSLALKLMERNSAKIRKG